jgi:hypothetical protein
LFGGEFHIQTGEIILELRYLPPVYAGEVLAIPADSTIKGHVSAISTAPMHKRARRLLNGGFTPPKTAQVAFDQLVLSDGTTVPIHSDSAVGPCSVANSRYLPKAQRPGMRQKLKGAMAPLREPNKQSWHSRAENDDTG